MKTDHALKAEVLAELAWEPMVNVDHIGATVRDGMVTLDGHVETYWQKRAAETAVARVKGVKGIIELLEVRLPLHNRRSDEEIAAATMNRLEWDGTLPPDAVRVLVKDGTVTLTGTVTHHYQVLAAARAVQTLWGIIAVANEITVRAPETKPANRNQIADTIRRALNRGWFAADTVHVAASGGTVTLSGQADTLRDRTLAVETAWGAPGTMVVENHIRIG
jgi:osmotically-inducible protein OsmY